MRRSEVSLRTAITVPLVVVLVLAIMVQAAIQYHTGVQLAQRQSASLLLHMSGTVKARLDAYLQAPVQAQRVVADAIVRHNLYAQQDISRVEAYLRGVYTDMYAQDRQIAVIGFGSAAGDYVALRRQERGNEFDLMRKDARKESSLKIIEGGGLAHLLAEIDAYDPRQRPWYEQAAKAGAAVRTGLYVNRDERGDLAISSVAPVYADGRLLGVVAADVTLEGLNLLLRDEAARLGGVLFIIDRSARLVAHSDPGAVARGLGPVALDSSLNPVMRAAAATLRNAVGPDGVSFKLQAEGATYLGRVESVRQGGGVDWRIVAMLPQEVLLADALRAQSLILLIAALIGLAGIGLGYWVVGRVTQPILRAAKIAQTASLDALSALGESSTPVYETTVLIRSLADMAARLQNSFARLEEQVLVDALTGLPTRLGLLAQVDTMLPTRSALFLIGIDDFRRLNDVVGWATSDHILKEVAARLLRLRAAPAYVARTGGDEFAVLYTGLAALRDLDRLGSDLLQAFDAPFHISRESLTLSASIGVVCATLEHDAGSEWLRRASAALSEAQAQRGRSACVLFRESLLEASIQRGRLANEIREAIAQRQFRAFYQPIVDLQSGEVVALEALVRWAHPERGVLMPATFMAVAEASDLTVQLGCYMLERVCAEARQFWQRHQRWLDIHVNVSARQLLQARVVDFIRETLQRSGMPGEKLTIEVTESSFINADDAITIKTLHGIKALGVKIAIDDFGTGYSSLSYLESLPIDCLKIDRSFVIKLVEDEHRAALLAATVIQVGLQLGLTTVAEGVEQASQLSGLLSLGCRRAQGYLLGVPLPLYELDFRPRNVERLARPASTWQIMDMAV